MKFSILATTLRNILLGLKKVRSTTPPLDNVYIRANAEDRSVTFASKYFGGPSIYYTESTSVEDSGQALFDRQLLADLSKQLKSANAGDFLQFDLEDSTVSVRANNTNFELEHDAQLNDIESWEPDTLDRFENEDSTRVKTLQTILQDVAPYISDDDARANLTYAWASDGTIQATDGHRLIQRPFPTLDRDLFIPRKVVELGEYIARVRTDDNPWCAIRTSDNGLQLDIGDWSIQAQAPTDLTYPDVAQVLPGSDARESSAAVRLDSLKDTHDTVGLCVNSETRNMEFQINGDDVCLKTEDQDTSATASNAVPADTDNNDDEQFDVLVNYEYFGEALTTFEGETDELLFEVHGANAPIIISDSLHDNDKIAVVMPLRK